MTEHDVCMWCERPAIRWCDAPILFLARGCSRTAGVTTLLAGHDEHGDMGMHTCSAAMCAEHVRQVGHISGTQPDSIDRCPYHIQHGDPKLKDCVGFASEVEPRRREIYAAIRRARVAAI